ncbi:hypothetical protein HPB47_020382 [Ixodes persulcatus]|uniref:Uncharacterized protein n=1 Tax=Ixodes persulcatus TaxID=34615 RepID=A0AC60QFI0_IXOPE|nr:hypothetical protein HPB47_020382 [Ixodes persulcatus]
MEQISSSMPNTNCEDAQFFNPFYHVLSSREVRRLLFVFDSRTYNFQLEQRDLHGDSDKRRVLLRFISSAKPATPCKVALGVNFHYFFDVPLKTINVSRHVKVAFNYITIIGNAIPEDLRLEVIVVDRTQEPGLLASLGGSGCGTDDVSAAKAQAAVADVKEDQDATVECVTVSLNCPLKRSRLVAPCRGADCRHIVL